MIRIVLLAISFIYGISNNVLGNTHNSFRKGQDYALFFAVDDYAGNSEFSNLRNPIKDARAIANELEEMYGFETMVYENPSKIQIFKVLEAWQKRSFKEEDQLFVFFSGHGTFWEFTKNGYFVPSGKGSDFGDYIELDNLGKIVTQIPCDHILLTIDACYSGTITQEIAFSKSNDFFERPGVNDDTERQNIVYRQLRNKSRLILTSGGKARTSDGVNRSPFSEVIINELRAAYTYRDGLVIFSDLLSKLERLDPVPHQGNLIGHESGGFVFVAKGVNVKKIVKSGQAESPKEAVNNPPKQENNRPINLSASSFTDRNGNTYGFKSMKDGKQWMTKNLNVNIEGSYCIDDKSQNCDKYGRLYTWEAAKKGCSELGDGWRLPNKAEWEKLRESYGGQEASYKSLLNNGGSGFSAQLGGYRFSDGDYYHPGKLGNYWSRTEYGVDDAWYFFFDGYDGTLLLYYYYKTEARSVRCIKD